MTKQGKLAFLQLLDQSALDKYVVPGTRLVLAVSGGADSVAMLYALHYYAIGKDWELTTVHINHQVRPEAAAEEEFVKNLCRSLNVPCIVRRVDGAAKAAGASPEEHWRNARYAEFRKIMVDVDAQFLCLGHTVDDLAETFLFHLTRGTGLEGLTFSVRKTTNGMDVLRPLWTTARDDIEKVLTTAGKSWITDSSNLDTRYSRNLIRQQVVPWLKKINPNVNSAILNVACDIARLLKEHPVNKDADVTQNNYLHVNAEHTDEFINRLRSFVRTRTGHALTRRQADQASRMLREKTTGLVSLAGKNTLVIMQDSVWICPEKEPDNMTLARHFISENPDHIACAPCVPTAQLTSGCDVVALDGIWWTITWDNDEPLRFRHRRAGDRVRSKTVGRLFIDHKIPWFLRDFALLAIDDNDQIVGVIVARPDDCLALNRQMLADLNLKWVRKESSHDLG